MTVALNGTQLTTITGVANRLYLIPFIPSKTVSVDMFNIEVTSTQAGSGILLGIYDATPFGGDRPNTLIASTGTTKLSGATAGVKSATWDPVTLNAGQVYFLAIHMDAGPTFRAIAQGALYVMRQLSTGGTAAYVTAYIVNSVTYSMLPTTAPYVGTSNCFMTTIPWLSLRLA